MRKDYGNKRDFKKIDIFYDGVYVGSTTWAKNPKEAKAAWMIKNLVASPKLVKCQYAE